MRDTKSVQVDGIDASSIECRLLVEEHSLDAIWVLCKSRCSCKEPAVSECTLFEVVGADSIGAPKVVVGIGEQVLGSFPLEGRQILQGLAHVTPVKGAVVRGEVLVVVIGSARNDGVEVVDSGLVAVLGVHAIVVGFLSLS